VKWSKYSCSQKIKTSLTRIFQLFTKIACTTFRGVWEALAHFQRHMWCLLTSKNILLPCCWKRRHVFFLVEWSVSTRIVQFVVNWPFSFLFFFLPQELHLGPICYLYFNFSPYFFNFCSWSFYRSFICF